jgi:hypothetical protein
MGDLLGKDKRKGFDWPILIYDSLRSAIPESRWIVLLAINESEKPIGGILSVARFIHLAILLPSRYGCCLGLAILQPAWI